MKRFTDRRLRGMGLYDKSELLERVMGGHVSHDATLPQHWLELMAREWKDRGFLLPGHHGSVKELSYSDYYEFIRSRCVWLYGDNDVLGGPFFLTEEADGLWIDYLDAKNPSSQTPKEGINNVNC